MQFDEFINKVGEDKIRAAVADGDASKLVSLMQEEGVELTDEMLEGIAGGTSSLFASIKDFFICRESYDNFIQSLRSGLTYL